MLDTVTNHRQPDASPRSVSLSLDKRMAIPLVFALALVIWLGINTVYRAALLPKQRTDFTVYQLAGGAVVDGTDIYQVHNVRGWAYVYPPPFAILMVPFAVVSVFWGALIWYLISVALILWAMLLCVRIVRSAFFLNDHPLILSLVPVGILLIWFMSGLARGQASVLLMWLVLAAFCWDWEGHDFRGGACLAGAILLKAFPLVLLAYFAWRKKWKFLLATLIAVIIGGLLIPGAVFGFQKNLAYWQSWEQIIARPALAGQSQRTQSDLNEQLLDPQKPRNQSLPAVLSRLTNNSFARTATIVIGLAMLGVMAAAGRKARGASALLTGSAVITWMLLIPPVSETHYFVLLLLPLMVLLAVALTDPDETTRLLSRWTLILFAAIVVASAGVRHWEIVGAPCWGTLMVWCALDMLAV